MTSMIVGKNVYWSKKYEPIVNRLTGKDREDKKRSFETNMDVLVFAAVLGIKEGASEKVASDRLEISIDVFNNRKMFGVIYLIGLLHTKDANVLRQEREGEMIAIFQDYAMGGLNLIEAWLDEQPTDLYGDKILLEKIHNELVKGKASDFTGAVGAVSF
ncbi:MAG: hypothetical protein Q7T44_17945 [Parvibaculum sp.]|nr:hypothetical protein [Parvibaculum sp.]